MLNRWKTAGNTIAAWFVCTTLLAGLPSTAQAEFCYQRYSIHNDSRTRWYERQTRDTAVMLVEAAERSASSNWGVYPSNTSRLMTIFRPSDFWLFRNAFTTSRTEPVDGAAASPGQVGYVPLSMAGTIVGATITVFGRATALETFRVGSGQEPLTYSRPTQSIEEITAVR